MLPNDRLEIARMAALSAGYAIREMQGQYFESFAKGVGDTVTAADKRSQEVIIKIIQKYFPRDNILAEEQELLILDWENGWSVDPLDGTARFETGGNGYAVSIAYLEQNIPVVGVLFFPALNILVEAQKGQGCKINGTPCWIKHNKPLQCSVVGLDICNTITDELLVSKIGPLARHSRYTRTDNAALSAYMLLTGETSMYFSSNTRHWDVASGALAVQEAGGLVLDGNMKPILWNCIVMGELFFLASEKMVIELINLFK